MPKKYISLYRVTPHYFSYQWLMRSLRERRGFSIGGEAPIYEGPVGSPALTSAGMKVPNEWESGAIWWKKK